MKATISKRPVAEKLGIKPGNRIAVLYSPKGYTAILAKLPAEVSLTTRLAGEPFDIVQAFYQDQRTLKTDLKKLRRAILPSGKVWICWRKGNVTELNRGAIHDLGESVKLDSVAECSIDEEWSAMKFMLPKAERKPPEERREELMAKNEATAKRKSPYSLHPTVAMKAKAIASLKEKTGKTIEQWVRAVQRSGISGAKEKIQWLKEKHGLGTNYAKWISERAESGATGNRPRNYEPDVLVERMFAGPKSALRPIYDHLLKLAFGLGKDVSVTPCSTIVPLRRRFVFAQIKPSSQTRIDLGLALKGTPASGRLIDTGGRVKGDRITHRIPITTVKDVDAEVKTWLKMAYDLDA